MATKDINPGLLSKVAKFVRHPTKDWAELDTLEPEQESVYSKQSLKALIERKRQNDFVRRREFDYLRKLRRSGPLVSPNLASRPSFFQSSLASNPNERATTLKKIDEIEAQMSKQWWRGKQSEVALKDDSYPSTTQVPLEVVSASSPGYEQTQSSALNTDVDDFHRADYESTQRGSSSAAELALVDGSQSGGACRSNARQYFETEGSEFSTTNLLSVEPGAGLADPELEEAAIRFANGDDAGAEEVLSAALQADNAPPDSADGWAAALFDLYRATGQQDNFDRVAIEYAQRFGRSAPAWFSMPELLGCKVVLAPSDQTAFANSPLGVWECPAELDVQILKILQASLSNATAPWHLNWRQFKHCTPEAAKALAALFDDWCAQPVQLHFYGADVLEKTLRAFTSAGDASIEPFWWQLRLDALRILRLQDAFELAALDFCVTYEVSPPPWKDARCDYVCEGESSAAPLETAHFSSVHSGSNFTADLTQTLNASMGLDSTSASVVELSGEVLGDAAETLDKLQAGLKESTRLVISCARLIRVDFSAAGSILNWVALRESEGCQVQFRDVPRLVAAFFNVIGINEHAQVVLRTS